MNELEHNYSERLYSEIEQWLQEDPYHLEEQTTDSLSGTLLSKQYELQKWFSEWINQLPDQQKQMVVDIVEEIVIYLSQYFQKPWKCDEIEQKTLREVRVMNPHILEIEQLKELSLHQLEYIEDKFRTRYQMYALVEGGVAGTGHVPLVILDLPVLLGINLNMIHHQATVYGYSLKHPMEQVLALKVLHAASLPKQHRQKAWQWLLEHAEGVNIDSIMEKQHSTTFNHGTVIQTEWLETLVKQWIKSMFLYGMKRRAQKSLSIIGILAGANMNYQFTKNIASFTSYFYRFRFLEEQK